MSPSTIFIDNIEDFLPQGGEPSNEAAKFELMRQFDILSSSKKRVKICAATNKPWTLDPSSIRRFDFKTLVKAP